MRVITPIAAAADYAEALFTARRAKRLLVTIVLACLLAQIALFLTYKYSDTVIPGASAAAATQPATQRAGELRTVQLLHYGVGLSMFLGLTSGIVLSLVLLLLLNVMLVGRLLGTGKVASAYVLSLVLLVLIFPWQTFLSRYDFTVPGVLYTWDELVRDGKIDSPDLSRQVLKWTRFAGFPGAAVLLVLAIQSKSARGVRYALGRDPEVGGVDVTTVTTDR